MNNEYVFELLVEEIPAWMLDPKLEQLQEALSRMLSDFGSSDANVRVGATPRRLYFALSNLPAQQPDREEEVKGPPLKTAFNGDDPSPALLGFLKKNSAELSAVTRRDDYVWLRRTVKGRSIAEALSTNVPKIIEGLRWPKMMRWGAGEHSFIRPVHSVISVLSGQVLPVSIFGTTASNTTRGHRTLGNDAITVAGFDDYVKQLRAHNVVVDANERVQTMRDRARDLAAEVSGVPAVDETIWDQWKYLTEFPNLIRAEFPERYLSLPEEVLTTVMRVHQKQLPVRKSDRLTSSFLAVVDQTGDEDGNARIGNSFVTKARFADAEFFYTTDRKRTLESRVDELSHLQFQERLGDYRAKSERIAALAEWIRSASRADASREDVAQAARLCKTDLVTEMVKEFTELQGKVGGIYAREEGLSPVVADAIYDHYLPTSVDGEFPRNVVGAIVALADKADTLAGFFSIGLKPTGSKDPFALRRAAQGLVQLLLNQAGWSLPIDIGALVDEALRAFGAADVRNDLLDFVAERVRTLLEARPFSFAYDELAAAMAAGWSGSLHDLQRRAAAIRDVRNDANFLSILDSAKRIANITAAVPQTTTTVDGTLLQHDTEKRLAELITFTAEQIDELTAAGDYSAALQSFAAMAPELERFFVDVMVMVDDERVRNNRVALLRKCGGVVARIGDVTKIVVDRSEYR